MEVLLYPTEMVPLIWRYLLLQFFTVLLLAAGAFIAILLTLRLNDIAHFASFGAGLWSILSFAKHQVAYILPFALPISCLISSTLLVQRLSLTHELTALRALGLSLHETFTPILLTAGCLSLLNFFLVSEVATHSNRATARLKEELRAMNPLVLLHNKHLMGLKGIQFESLGPSKPGDYTEKAVIAIPAKDKDRLHLLLAESLKADATAFTGKHLTFIAPLGKREEERFDRLLIEEVASETTKTEDISLLFEDPAQSISHEQLSLGGLLSRCQGKNRVRCLAELFRRISWGLSVLTFSLMGLSFGMSIGRMRSSKPILMAFLLVAFFLTATLLARHLKQELFLAFFLYFSPHALIIALSWKGISRITAGVEAR